MQPRRLTTWLSIFAIAALFSLAACSTPATVCPPLRDYDTEWQVGLTSELERLNKDHIEIGWGMAALSIFCIKNPSVCPIDTNKEKFKAWFGDMQKEFDTIADPYPHIEEAIVDYYNLRQLVRVCQ